ncbi:MAG: S41 family peptidase, partial [Thermomicrobium sp.]|nr:S41 family peptidase [Thermomicrobium sp.]
LQRSGIRGLVLDLRGNPGGLVDEAVSVSGLFLPPETVVFRSRDRSGNETTYRTKPDVQPTTLPLVVLVDGDSASAAEIVAGALQDYRRATIVGQRTFGTGTVLVEFRLQDGSALLIGTQLWVTPNGRIIWRNGIEPDVPVALGSDQVPLHPRDGELVSLEALRTDAQATRAWQLLTGEDPAPILTGFAGCVRCR